MPNISRYVSFICLGIASCTSPAQKSKPAQHFKGQEENNPSDRSVAEGALVSVGASLPPKPRSLPPKPRCEAKTITVGDEIVGYQATGKQCRGLKQGPWRYTFLDWKPLRAGEFKDGQETGVWTFWYHGGALRAKGNFAQGRRTGLWFRMHENGEKSLEGRYKEGLRNGRWRRWHDNGQLYEDRVYDEGRREGIHKKWSRKGLLQYIRHCKDDRCKILCRERKRSTCKSFL